MVYSTTARFKWSPWGARGPALTGGHTPTEVKTRTTKSGAGRVAAALWCWPPSRMVLVVHRESLLEVVSHPGKSRLRSQPSESFRLASTRFSLSK